MSSHRQYRATIPEKSAELAAQDDRGDGPLVHACGLAVQVDRYGGGDVRRQSQLGRREQRAGRSCPILLLIGILCVFATLLSGVFGIGPQVGPDDDRTHHGHRGCRLSGRTRNRPADQTLGADWRSRLTARRLGPEPASAPIGRRAYKTPLKQKKKKQKKKKGGGGTECVIADFEGLGPFSYQWQSSLNGTTWEPIAGATAATFTPDDNANILPGDQAGLQLRVVVSYVDGEGRAEAVTSAPTGPVGLDWDGLANVNNTFAGNAGDDIGDGSNGIDTLNGNDGSDILRGAGGADIINGGNGNDILNGGGGDDTVNGNAGNDALTYTVGDGNDTMNGGADVDTLAIIGTAAANTLNVVYNGTVITQVGGGGSVTAIESVTVDLGAAADTLVYVTTPTSNVTVNLATGIAAGFTTIANVENVTGSGGNDTLTGNATNNVIDGGAGDDILTGGGGNDTITGAAGIDTSVYSGALQNFSFDGVTTLLVTDSTGAEGANSIVQVDTWN